jgi:hypothetical protein
MLPNQRGSSAIRVASVHPSGSASWTAMMLAGGVAAIRASTSQTRVPGAVERQDGAAVVRMKPVCEENVGNSVAVAHDKVFECVILDLACEVNVRIPIGERFRSESTERRSVN